jgi:hypothetical protein
MNEADFWNDPKRAQAVIADLKVKRAQIEPLEEVMKGLEDAQVGYEMAKEARSTPCSSGSSAGWRRSSCSRSSAPSTTIAAAS